MGLIADIIGNLGIESSKWAKREGEKDFKREAADTQLKNKKSLADYNAELNYKKQAMLQELGARNETTEPGLAVLNEERANRAMDRKLKIEEAQLSAPVAATSPGAHDAPVVHDGSLAAALQQPTGLGVTTVQIDPAAEQTSQPERIMVSDSVDAAISAANPKRPYDEGWDRIFGKKPQANPSPAELEQNARAARITDERARLMKMNPRERLKDEIVRLRTQAQQRSTVGQ